MSYHQTIYKLLRQAGMTEAGALGVIGNWECESNCEPDRLQGDFSPYRTASKDYVRRADNHQMTEDEFAKPIGFSLAQWTYPARKRNLWRFWQQYGGSLGNVQMLVDFAIKEFKTDFIPDWRLLCSTSDIYEATKAVCYRFENPAVKNDKARYQAALKIKSELELGEWERTEVQSPELTEQNENLSSEKQQDLNLELIPATEFWPPRMLCNGMSGADVEVLQAILKARGWFQQNPDGIFGSFLEAIVRKFQTAYNLDVDGIVGPLTWGELLQR